MDKKLEKLESLLKMMNESITKDDFVSSFKSIVKQVLNLEKALITRVDTKTSSAEKELAKLKTDFAEVINKAKQESDSSLSGFKKRTLETINSLFIKHRIGQKLTSILDEHLAKIKEVDRRIANIRDGVDGKDGTDGIIGKDGKDGSPDNAEQIRDKLEILLEEWLDISAIKGLKKILEELEEKIKAIPRGIIGGGDGGQLGGHVRYKDLSASLDGSTRTFSMPAFGRILSVQLSSFPNILRDGIDFTVNGSTFEITFTSEISDSSISAGQTLVILYAEM